MDYNTLEIVEQIAYGFGVVNFMQDDYLFGSLFALADISSIALLTIGIIVACDYGDPALFVLSNLFPIAGPILYIKILEAQNIKFEFKTQEFLPYGITALVIRAASASLSILRSNRRATKWNAGLSEVLLLDSKGKKLSLEPIVNPINKNSGIALKFEF